MANIIIYSKDHCPYCILAKEFFNTKQIPFTEIRVDTDPEKLAEMMKKSNLRTVPQIFINDQSIGGYDDLVALSKTEKLNQLLNS